MWFTFGKQKIWKCNTATYGSDDWKTDHSTERAVRYEPTAGGDCPEDSGQEPWNTQTAHVKPTTCLSRKAHTPGRNGTTQVEKYHTLLC